ncbi:MAG: 39S ribosomal protein L45, mitochondrial, partial [Paramarteilia canceri]
SLQIYDRFGKPMYTAADRNGDTNFDTSELIVFEKIARNEDQISTWRVHTKESKENSNETKLYPVNTRCEQIK